MRGIKILWWQLLHSTGVRLSVGLACPLLIRERGFCASLLIHEYTLSERGTLMHCFEYVSFVMRDLRSAFGVLAARFGRCGRLHLSANISL